MFSSNFSNILSFQEGELGIKIDLGLSFTTLHFYFRFRKFYKLEDDRKVMLLNHVVFLDKPSVDRCFFHTSMSEECTCTECMVSLILRNERRLVPNGE